MTEEFRIMFLIRNDYMESATHLFVEMMDDVVGYKARESELIEGLIYWSGIGRDF